MHLDDETGNYILQGWRVTDAQRLSQLDIPRPFQTPAYVRALLTSIRNRRALPEGLEAAVDVRVDKQGVLYEGARRSPWC
ncbi:Scr1 family TA system antitoxin-like transcriptional regulator [Streptomyces sp. NPDC006617]|uniref:Scr1 family TA system antitoxin-like transcriptional regulator n=1 Tax=Streptomyces sp. NPDC006617 TaxID=3155354 RepID=UPI0033ACCA16